jgi:YARHG domain
MKKIILFLLFIVVVSCNKENNSKVNTTTNDPFKNIYGNWVGISISNDTTNNEFDEPQKMNLRLKKIDNNIVYGQIIIAGTIRAIKGKMDTTKNGLKFTLKGMFENKNSGQFIFTIRKDSLSGTWIGMGPKSRVSKREYKLTKQEFEYNPKAKLPLDEEYIDFTNVKIDTTKTENEYEFENNEMYRSASEVVCSLNASTTKLEEKHLKNLKKLELEIIRNTIYARHGYAFKNKSMRQFFDGIDWYVPVSNNVTKELTFLEKENITLLEKFEKYATDNYANFGR